MPFYFVYIHVNDKLNGKLKTVFKKCSCLCAVINLSWPAFIRSLLVDDAECRGMNQRTLTDETPDCQTKQE